MSHELGERLQELLKRRNMTQQELADATQLSAAAVSRYVTGKRRPRASCIVKIAKALDVTPQELLGTVTRDEVDQAVRFVVKNAGRLTGEQRKELALALLGR